MTYHIIARGRKWAVKRAGAQRATRIFAAKLMAMQYTDPFIRRGANLVVHNKDGSVELIIDLSKSPIYYAL